MQSSSIKIMVVAVVVAILLLFGVNLLSRYGHFDEALASGPAVLIASIKTISVEENGNTTTLSSSQEQKVAAILAALRPVSAKLYPIQDPSLHITKIAIKNYDGSEVDLIPLSFEGRNLVFSSPQFPGNDYLIESSAGELYNILQSRSTSSFEK